LIKKRTHPPLELQICKVKRDLWSIFRDYHYLNKDLGPFCICYAAFLDGNPVAFLGVRHVRFNIDYYIVSRLVVLPDYQGVGIGRRVLTFVAEFYRSQTHLPFHIITSNPQLAHGRMPGWHIMRVGRTGQLNNSDFQKHMRGPYTSSSRSRLTVTLEYLGVPK
jgi:GNAT superfamily N-acetyltransferase